MSDSTVIAIAGVLDHARITALIAQVTPRCPVIVDLTHATGAYSTLMAACIQVAIVTGRPVTVRGGSPRFVTSVAQMRLGHLLHIEVGPGIAAAQVTT